MRQRRVRLLRLEMMINVGPSDVVLLQGDVERVEWDGLKAQVDSFALVPYPVGCSVGRPLVVGGASFDMFAS